MGKKKAEQIIERISALYEIGAITPKDMSEAAQKLAGSQKLTPQEIYSAAGFGITRIGHLRQELDSIEELDTI